MDTSLADVSVIIDRVSSSVDRVLIRGDKIL